MEELIAKRYHLKHGLKDLYIRDVRHSCTGIDITWGTKKQAFSYATYSVAVVVARALQAYCNLYPVEE